MNELYFKWIHSLDKEDEMMLAVFLTDLYVKKLRFKVKSADELVGEMPVRDEKTVRTWRRYFYCNGGSLPELARGQHARYCILNEEDMKKM